ncbi:retrovirus-related pol polyprotein from transposon TNT 1-94 [Tanacetum coccineum]
MLRVDQLTEDPSSSRQKDLVFVKSLADDIKVTIPGVERPWLSEAEGFILPNNDTGKILPAKLERNTIDPSVAFTDSSSTNYDSVDKSSVCNTPLPLLGKLEGTEPISGPKTIKSILKSKSTLKAEALKGIIINEPSSAPAKGKKSSSASKVHLAHAGKLKSVKIEDDPSFAIYPICKLCESYDHDTNVITGLSPKKERSVQEILNMASKDVKLVCDIRKPIWYLDSGCSRHMTGVKSYLHKYMEQPGPKVVFGDDSTCTTEGYGSIKCNGVVFTKNFFSPYTPEQNGIAERKNRTLIEAARTMLSGSVFSKQYWTEAVATACYSQNRSTIMKRHLKTPYEIFHKRIPNISFLHVFGCPVNIRNHEDHLGKFNEKADDGYLLGYSLVSKAFRVFNTRRQQTEETYHITFDESPEAIKFSKPLVDNINIVESERYPLDEYLHPYEPSQRYQTNNNDVSFIEPYECSKPVVLETEVSSEKHGQTDQNDQSIQNYKILNDDYSEHSNHTNDEKIIDNLPNTKEIQIPEHLSSPNSEDTSAQNTTAIPRAGMLTRAMAKKLSATSAHECLFVDFLSDEEPKKVSEALKHPGWVDAMQDELNQFARNKV